MIPRPIKSLIPRGPLGLEYFISTHGTRKGLGDTRFAPRTRAI